MIRRFRCPRINNIFNPHKNLTRFFINRLACIRSFKTALPPFPSTTSCTPGFLKKGRFPMKSRQMRIPGNMLAGGPYSATGSIFRRKNRQPSRGGRIRGSPFFTGGLYCPAPRLSLPRPISFSLYAAVPDESSGLAYRFGARVMNGPWAPAPRTASGSVSAPNSPAF